MMIGSALIHQRQQVLKTTLINCRIGLLERLLKATNFVNVDITHNRADRQAVLVWRTPRPDPAHLLRIIDPALEQWRWPVLDIWGSADASGSAGVFCQIRIDVS